MKASSDLRNIGIFAHVDAGKTTLTEQMLLLGGAIRKAGSVDRGTAHTDSLPVEQRRGISVQAACVSLHWNGVRINLIDTPGHADFASEIERSLWALDGAILIVSAADGVEPQTELLFQTLKRQSLPCVIFINKTDREGADVPRTMAEIRKRLTRDAALLPVSPAAADAAVPDSSAASAPSAQGAAGFTSAELHSALIDALSSRDDELMETWLETGDVPDSRLLASAETLSGQGFFHPVLCGSALRGQGVTELLDAVVRFLPSPDMAEVPARSEVNPLCGVIFGVTPPSALGRGAWVRLFSGALRNRDSVQSGSGTPLKITQIRDVDGTDTGALDTGQIGLVYGLTGAVTGQILGNPSKLPRSVDPGSMAKPLMTVQAIPDRPEELDSLYKAFLELAAEDPLLGVRFLRDVRELHIQVMGRIHLEILAEIIKNRFGLEVSFGKPSVIYKETIASEAIGSAVYTMPKPCWAILHFRLKPGPRGSGITYRSRVSFRDIPERYQHQVEQALPTALAQGRLGWEVTDLEITLEEGNYHHIHTHPLDFIVATPWGIQDGLRNGGSTLLEPLLEIRFLLPADSVGKVMGDIVLMRGEVKDSSDDGDRTILTASVPAAECLDYSERLAALTGGRGSMAAKLCGYRECPPEKGAVQPRRGVDPLDTSKYILAARSALEGGIFDA